jgi:hypothetical protein
MNAQKTAQKYFQKLDRLDSIATISDEVAATCSGGDFKINGVEIDAIVNYIDKNNLKPNESKVAISANNDKFIIYGRPVSKRELLRYS